MDGAGARYDGGRYRVGAGRRREGYMGVMESRRQRMVCVCVVCESIACSVRYIVDVFFCISSNLISSSPPLLLSSSPPLLIPLSLSRRSCSIGTVRRWPAAQGGTRIGPSSTGPGMTSSVSKIN